MCGRYFLLQIKKDDLDGLKSGKTSINSLKYLTPSQRELLISKICGECFDSLFEDKEDKE